MGGPAAHTRPSLDRLKALDALPDIDTQLAEAQQLCTHPARAEMILKWLLAKLKWSLEYATRPDSWDLLSACIRLLYLQKAASLLSASSFVGALQSTCAASHLTIPLLSALTRLLALIFDLSEAVSGPAMKAVLTIDSTVAASISGNWFQHLSSIGHELGSSSLIEDSLLQPPLRLWGMRKCSNMDDQLFSSHCLVPVSSLLTLLNNDRTFTAKRKRGMYGDGSAQACRSSLEALIAKHIILPARAVFFKESELQPRKASRNRPSGGKPGIKERLGPLKVAIRSDESGRLSHAVALILDVALRAVSMPTPRQRSQERSWIECVFEALQSCLNAQSRIVLAAMIETLVNRNFALSSRTSLDIVRNHALPSENSDNPLALDLVSALVHLDPNIFTDRETAQSVFDALPSSLLSTDSQPVNSRSFPDSIHSIVVSIMKAFAQGRKLPVFVDLWNNQLLDRDNTKSGPIWLRLGDSFAELMEESMSNEQIIALFDQTASTIKEVALASEGTDSTGKVGASSTILGSLLCGVRNDELIAKLQSRLDELLLALFNITEAEDSAMASNAPSQLWALYTRAFDLWFPHWAAQQSDRQVIAERGVSLLTRKTFQMALLQAADVIATKSDDRMAPALCARTFVATLCECFLKYEQYPQCVSLAQNALQQLAQQKEAVLPALLRHTYLLERLETDSQQEIVSALIGDIHALQPGTDDSADKTVEQTIPALLSSNMQPSKVDTFPMVLKQLRDSVDGKRRGDIELYLLKIMRNLVLGLGTEQRVALLDAIIKLRSHADLAGSESLQERLSLIVEVVTASPTDLYFTESAESIWALSSLFKPKAKGKSVGPAHVLATSSNLRLLQEIVRHVLGAWTTAQGKKGASQAPLVTLSKRIKAMCTEQVTFVGRTASLAVLESAVNALEKSSESAKQDMPHRDSNTVESYIKTLLKDVRALNQSPDSSKINGLDGTEKAQALGATFAALLAIPEPLLGQLSSRDGIVKDIVAASDQQAQLSNGNDKLASLDAVLFRLDCKYATRTGQELTQQAEKILQQDLKAQEYNTILAAYEDVLSKADKDWKSDTISSLLRANANNTQSILLLQRAVKTLSKEDSEASGVKIFAHVLHVASTTSNSHTSHLAWQTLATMIKEQPFLVNQHGIEQTLSKMTQTLYKPDNTSPNFMNLTKVLEAFFSHHRSRLQGRFHLLVALFQAFIANLFRKTELGTRQARSLARILESFCNPPRIRHRGKTSALIDEARKAQAHAGQFAQYILHYYCAQVLTGTLDTGIREALMPGIWALIEAIEINKSEGINALSAAMNNSERAVLRSVYEDWKRFGKWEGL